MGRAFKMGYAARRNEIERDKGGQSIAVSGTTGWAARPEPATETETTSPAARLGLATEVKTRSPRANAILQRLMANPEVHILEGIALPNGEAPDRSGEAPVALCPTPCVNRSRNPERRCALSVGAHDREKMRAAPGVDAAMPDADEAKAFIAESEQRWHSNVYCRHLKDKIVRHLARPPRDRQLCDDCKDAARAGSAHFASLLQHVDRIH